MTLLRRRATFLNIAKLLVRPKSGPGPLSARRIILVPRLSLDLLV